MPAKFLFVNENEVSFTSVRPKRTSTSVRRHVRLQRGLAHVQQKQPRLQMQAHPPKVLQISDFSAKKNFSPPFNQKTHGNPRGKIGEHLTSFSNTPKPVPGFENSCHFDQLYPDLHELINFYCSFGSSQQTRLSPDSITIWPTMIIRKALESERHTLFLLCYITSIIYYLNHSTRDNRISVQGRNSPLSSEVFSCPSSTPSFDDGLYSAPKFEQDPYLSHPSKLSPSYAWQHSNLSASYMSPNSASLDPNCLPQFSGPQHLVKIDYLRLASRFTIRCITSTATARPSSLSFSDSGPVLALCSSLASDPIHLTHQAISTLKSRLSTEYKASPATEFLFPVWCLFRAAILQGDKYAAAAHERFLRHLVFQAEDVNDLPSWLIRVIVDVDLKLGDANKGANGEESSGGDLLVESEMRERMASKPDSRRETKENDSWWDARCI